MKHIPAIALMIFVIPAALSAGSLRCTLPAEVAEAHLLSGGTPALVQHYRVGYEHELAAVSKGLRIEELEHQVTKAQDELEKKNRAYDDTLSSIRTKYLSSLTVTLDSIEASISPSTSALGDVTFFYTVRNTSDRIITDITYKPRIGGKTLPTTSSIVLEFMHPDTLISGVGPGETLSNQGHEPERFQFFISELSREEIQALKTDATAHFGIEITDMHFADRKGYKGQVAVEDFLSAFSRRLRPLKAAIEQAEADLEAKKSAHAKALSALAGEKKRLKDHLTAELAALKKDSVRFSARAGKKNRFEFDDVPDGTYCLYATDGRGNAVFEQVVVNGARRTEVPADMKEDPFVP